MHIDLQRHGCKIEPVQCHCRSTRYILQNTEFSQFYVCISTR